MEDILEEVLELANFSVLCADKFGLAMQLVPTNDENYLAPENVPASKNQGEEVYNIYCGSDGIFWRCLTRARNHKPCVKFSPDIELTKLQLFQIFL